MIAAEEPEGERTPLLSPVPPHSQRLTALQQDEEAHSIISSALTKEEIALAGSTVGERLPYNSYSTIDHLHDLVKDSYRHRSIHSHKSVRYSLLAALDSCSGWLAAAITGTITACVAFLVDVSVATVSDWKIGYCRANPLLSRENCCRTALTEESCVKEHFKPWSTDYASSYAIYVAFALAFGIISGSATMLTKQRLPAVSPSPGSKIGASTASHPVEGKVMYMAAGSGIPEIKTILSGFVIPNFLDFKVLIIKAFGAVFAVSTGMTLGKEGPFVHISTCVGYLVATRIPKYRDNGRKMREMLSAACASGLSVAFGAPIGGVLFSYEEISTYFPRKVLWRAFLCSLVAAMVLKVLNPTGTGKLVLFETGYGTSYSPVHYLVFVLLGIAGGLFGGVFCKANFIYSKWFRSFPLIQNHPVFEVFLVVAATALIQFPNPLTREPGDIIIKNLLVDCNSKTSPESWICRNEAGGKPSWAYLGSLTYGTVAKLVLTIVTFGVKVPSGVIIPALDGGAFFGRLIGQWITSISPGIFAMVGAGAFLAGVSRMTISLCVIMFELTGEIEYIVPNMVAILVAKWVADALSSEGVYDLAQTVLGHPFLDQDHSISLLQRSSQPYLVEELIPPKQTMDEITVIVPKSNKVKRQILEEKLDLLKRRGLMDAGLVLVQESQDSPHILGSSHGALSARQSRARGFLQGYIGEAELNFGLSATHLGGLYPEDAEVRLLGDADEGDFDMTMFVDRTPLTICDKAPLEYLVEMFGKLGLRYIMVTEEGTGLLIGVVIKKRLIQFLEHLH